MTRRWAIQGNITKDDAIYYLTEKIKSNLINEGEKEILKGVLEILKGDPDESNGAG